MELSAAHEQRFEILAEFWFGDTWDAKRMERILHARFRKMRRQVRFASSGREWYAVTAEEVKRHFAELSRYYGIDTYKARKWLITETRRDQIRREELHA
jgi:hypothetical protein